MRKTSSRLFLFASMLFVTNAYAQFSPSQVPNLALWLKADSLVVKDVNNNVSSWVNCIGGGLDFNQANAATQPKWVPSVLFGKPVIRFDGTNDFLSAGDNYDIGTNSRTVFIVAKSNNLSLGTFFAKSLSSNATNRYAIRYNASGYDILYHDNTQQAITVNPPPAGFNIFSNSINRALTTVKAYRNSNQIGSSLTSIQGASYNFNSTYRFLIGAYNNATDAGEQNFLNGDIAEIIIYNSALPDTTRNKVEQYLRLKYAQQITLGPDTTITYGFCPISLTASSGFTNYLWSTGATTSTTTVNKPGAYWVRATDAFGYVSSDTILVTYPGNLNFPNDTICIGVPKTVSPLLVGNYSYLWSTGATSPSISLSQPGSYFLKVTDTSGCIAQSDTFILALDSFKLTVSLGADTSICLGNSISLQSGQSGASSYLWNDGITSDSRPINASGMYSISVTNTRGCIGIDSIQVSILGVAPTVNFVSDSVCLGNLSSFTNLSSIPPPDLIVSYVWNFGGGVTSNSFSPTYTFGSPGQYSVSLIATSNVGCSSFVTKTTYVRSNPTAQIQSVSLACLNNSVSIFQNSFAAAGDSLVTYNWDFGDGSFSTSPNPQHIFSSTGLYTVTLNANTVLGCRDADTAFVSVVSSAPLTSSFTLTSPPYNYMTTHGNVVLSWNASSGAYSYGVELASDNNFSNVILQTSGLTNTQYLVSGLPIGKFFWRANAANVCGQVVYSNISFFEVLDLNNLGSVATWLKADSLVVKDASNNVSSWINSEASGLNFDQTSSSLQPRWINNVLNGKPVLRFDGTNDFLSAGDNYDIGTNSRTVFVVGKSNNATSGCYYAKSLAANANNRLGFQYNTSGLNCLWHDNASSPQLITVIPGPTGYSLFANTINRNSQQIKLYKGGSQIGSTLTGIQGSSYNFNSSSRFLIGAYNNATDIGEQNFLNGDIAEIIIFNTALSDSSRNKVEHYLRMKYAPQINLGPDVTVAYGVCDTMLKPAVPFPNLIWSTGDTTQTIRVNKAGKYWVSSIDIFGYVTSDTIEVNYPYKGSNVSNATICLGDTIQLVQEISPASAYAIVWNNGTTSYSISVSAPGIFSAMITDTNGCSIFTDTISIAIDSFKLWSLLPKDTSICSGNVLPIDSGTYHPIYYVWSDNSLNSFYNVNSLGVAQVGVVVTDVNNCIATDTAVVVSNQVAPSVNFSPNSVCFGDTVAFLNTTNQVGADLFNTFLWNFGDGNVSTEQSPKYLFNFPGTYQVSLSLVTDSNCSGFVTKPIKVSAAPTANFSFPAVLCAGTSSVFFDNSVVLFNDSVTQWKWTFNGVDTSTLKTPTYEFSNQGPVSVQLIAATDVGCADTVNRTVEVFAPLIADFSLEKVCIGDSTSFEDVSASFSIVNRLWNFGDGTPFSVINNPKHKYAAPGNYLVTLQVENAIGCIDTVVKFVNILAKPVAKIGSTVGCEGVIFSLLDSSMVSEPIANWWWTINGNSYSGVAPQLSIADSGSYSATLKIVTQSGCVDSTQGVVHVLGNPSANFSPNPLYGEAPATIEFINTSIGASTYLWSFGDGELSSDFNPTHTFISNDTFDISLQATSAAGCQDEFARSFIVAPTRLDIAVTNVEVTKIEQIDGSIKVKIEAQLSNLGTRVITDVQLYATVGTGGVIAEDWTGVLPSGQTLTYTFVAEFVLSQPNASTYVCVRAASVNNGEQEITTENNTDCATLTGSIQLAGPSPNPVSDKSVLGIILPKSGTVTIDVVDLAGHYVIKGDKLTMPAGRSDYVLWRNQFAVGEYIIRVFYNDEKLTKKFVVK